ncbi:hypothetical protein BaRGS_00006953 [Batillaria attramentaria]|uniref:Uncharacterized protein n=1 Tax=Batillaria attramentaria TaxID=370345 RepID=A0ABD0LS65_9CAEN
MAASSASVSGTVVGPTAQECMRGVDYRVVCGIEVNNWTRFLLTEPMVRPAKGVVKTPPDAVLPGHRGVMVVRKSWGLLSGTCGTVSWLIESLNRRLFVMWHVPYSFDRNRNTLAVGLSKVGCIGHSSGRSVYNTMRTAESSGNITFSRLEFGRESNTLIFRDDEIEVEGTMGSSHKAVVKIVVRPTRRQDYAPTLEGHFGMGGSVRNLLDFTEPFSSA